MYEFLQVWDVNTQKISPKAFVIRHPDFGGLFGGPNAAVPYIEYWEEKYQNLRSKELAAADRRWHHKEEGFLSEVQCSIASIIDELSSFNYSQGDYQYLRSKGFEDVLRLALAKVGDEQPEARDVEPPHMLPSQEGEREVLIELITPIKKTPYDHVYNSEQHAPRDIAGVGTSHIITYHEDPTHDLISAQITSLSPSYARPQDLQGLDNASSDINNSSRQVAEGGAGAMLPRRHRLTPLANHYRHQLAAQSRSCCSRHPLRWRALACCTFLAAVIVPPAVICSGRQAPSQVYCPTAITQARCEIDGYDCAWVRDKHCYGLTGCRYDIPEAWHCEHGIGKC
jgi:hypothetical protein